MKSFAIFLVVCAAIGTLIAAPKKTISKQMVLEAIKEFRADPMSERGLDAAGVVIRFVDQGPDVIVTL